MGPALCLTVEHPAVAPVTPEVTLSPHEQDVVYIRPGVADTGSALFLSDPAAASDPSLHHASSTVRLLLIIGAVTGKEGWGSGRVGCC